MPKQKLTGYEVVADHEKRIIWEALGISKERQEILEQIANEAFDFDEKSKGMQHMGNHAKTMNEYAYMAYTHGRLYAELSELQKMSLQELLGSIKPKATTTWTDKFMLIGLILWVVWLCLAISEVLFS